MAENLSEIEVVLNSLPKSHHGADGHAIGYDFVCRMQSTGLLKDVTYTMLDAGFARNPIYATAELASVERGSSPETVGKSHRATMRLARVEP